MTLLALFRNLHTRLSDALHLAVPAASGYTRRAPRWRSLGQPVLPYHYLRPVPVVVREAKR
jgi:hypothetical protein